MYNISIKSFIRRNQTVTFSRIDRNSIKFIRILFQSEENRIIVIEGKDIERFYIIASLFSQWIFG